MPKPFTLAEANALIPELSRVLTEVSRLLGHAQRHHDRLLILDAIWDGRADEPGNPDHAELLDSRIGLADSIAAIKREIRDRILERGIRFPPGGLEHGLLDFPSTWRGRPVYLCWRLGEPRVLAWHDLDGGFAGRRPLTPEQEAEMGHAI